MKNLRILARTVVLEKDKVLLVRNKGADFWYPPGGGWEYDSETIVECASREVTEETGYTVDIERMLWLQEFHEKESIFFETFWLAKISQDNTQTINGLDHHTDLDQGGLVVEARWYSQSELKDLRVFPERVKSVFHLVNRQEEGMDPFIGAFL